VPRILSRAASFRYPDSQNRLPVPWTLSPERLYPRFLPVGDCALTVEFGDTVSRELNDAAVALDLALAAAEIEGIVETAPSYRSLLICYDPAEITHGRLVAAVRRLLSRPVARLGGGTAHWTIPIAYDPPFGEDVPELALKLGLSEDAAIALHAAGDYRVFVIGFAPGLPYLGGLPDSLHIPRREVLRAPIPVGAVMIGGAQCAISPVVVPSGFYKVGETPLRPFEPDRENPFLFRAGDRVRFRRIDGAEFQRLAAMGTDALLPLVRNAP